MDSQETRSLLGSLDDSNSSDPPTSDDAGGIESQLRVGRAIKNLVGREPAPVNVGRYRIERRIGDGGMSVVYEARDAKLDRQVAIKVLRASTASAPNWQARLRREATAMAKLGHVNIAHVYEVGEHEGCPFIAMELIKGVTLRRWLKERERSVPEIIAMYVQAARGLAAAHDAGLVHRDFKPDNVIIDQHGWARVLDFGLVLTAGEGGAPVDVAEAAEDGEPVSDDPNATREGTVVGTPAYMAPEQMAGETVDGRADQFALCVSLYEALHGQRPFPGNSLTEISESLRTRRARPVIVDTERVPEAISKVIARGLDPEPDHRYPTVDAFIDALVLAQQQREKAELSDLERRAEALDFEATKDLRWRHSSVIGLVLAAVVGVLYTLRVMGIHQAGYPDAIGFGLLLIVLQRLSESRINKAGANAFGRRWARVLTIGSSVVVYSLAFSWAMDFDFTLGLAVTFLVAGSASLSVILFVDPRLSISSAFLLATAVALAFYPSLRPLWLILGLLGAYVSLALVWREPEAEITQPPPQ